MKALNSPSYRVRGFSASSSSSLPLKRLESCCLKPQNVAGFVLFSSICVKRGKPFFPIACLTPKTQVDLDAADADDQSEETYSSKKVHVKFRLEKECLFGEHFFLVGNDPLLGLWSPENAIPLNWSDGHVWSVELDIPVGKPINFKFILKRSTGEILWQPGPNRVLQTWETNNTIIVSEDWQNAEFQKISEEEQGSTPHEDYTVKSDAVIVTENLTLVKEEVVVNVNDKSVIANNNVNPDEQPIKEVEPLKKLIVADNIAPSQEKPKTIVADNTSYSGLDPSVNASSGALNETIVDHTNENSAAILKKEAAIAEESLGNNGRVAISENPASTNTDANPFNYEGEPILVPGLPSSAVVSAEEANQNQVDQNNSFNDTAEEVDAEDRNLPELHMDAKQERRNNPPEKGTASEKLNAEEDKLENDLQQKPHLAKREEQMQPDSELDDDNVLQNDLQWGRKVFMKFLINLGLL
ncbi:hypothetical protein UlMin_000491 [Ulmus minor]